MSNSQLKAFVQNQEWEGTAAADLNKPPAVDGVKAFAESIGIDTQQYYPFGVDIYIGEPGYMIETTDRAHVAILAVDQNVVGNSYDEIEKYVNQNGKLPYIRFNTKSNLDEALKYIKRLKVVVTQRYDFPDYEETQSVNL